jgi:probable phosphoglycerate mutase
MTELLLIRHAVNDFVKTGKLAGWTPEVHLNADGKAQAEALGRRLAETHLDAVYSSPLERTVETAQAVLAHHPEVALQLLEDVGEVHYGDWQGQEIRTLVNRKMWAAVQTTPSRVRFPNGEAMRDVQIRAVNAIEMLIERHPRQRIAVVSHSDVIKMIVAFYLGMPLDVFQRIEISPASLTVLAMAHGRPTIVQVNESSYLPQRSVEGEEKTLAAILVGVVGQPGERTFYLQAQRDDSSAVTVLIEKTQAMGIAEDVDRLMTEIGQDGTGILIPALSDPGSPTFRAGKLELKYHLDSDRILLEIGELKGEGTPGLLHWWGTFDQIRALGESAKIAVRGGREQQH